MNNFQQALDIANRAQHRHDATITVEKRIAKQRAAEIVRDHLKGTRILDIGGEGWYAEYFPPMEQFNLPNDMHTLSAINTYDAIIAMHVLEHSPFPLAVLLNIYQALKPTGIMYAAVPRPVEPFLTLPSHFAVLAKENWVKLFNHAGFRPVFVESGRFGNYDPAIEERFVCTKQP